MCNVRVQVADGETRDALKGLLGCINAAEVDVTANAAAIAANDVELATLAAAQLLVAPGGDVTAGSGSGVGRALGAIDPIGIDVSVPGALSIGLTGIVALARGGTNADLSATGSAKHVLRQASAGAAITVDALDSTELGDVGSKTGAGTAIVFNDSPTIITPTIASLTNAQHNHQNASGGGTLDAAAIAAGTMATARLGSGTADGTTFLRGDQTWATPAGGSRFEDKFEADMVNWPTSNAAGWATQNGRVVNAFDQTTDEYVILEGVIDDRWTGTGTPKLEIKCMSAATATTARCQFEAVTEFISDGESLNVDAFDGTADSGNVAFTATAYQQRTITITLTPATTPAVGDKYRIKVNRDAGYTPGGADSDYAGDVLVVSYRFYEEAA